MTAESPLTDAQRDNLIRTMIRQIRDRDERIEAQRLTIAELRAELVAVHEELSALKAGADPGIPFLGGTWRDA